MNAPLHGIRVVDVTIARAGPTAVRQLADWGADVIRVEAPTTRDSLTGQHDGSDYLNLHRNKRLIRLDLKTSEGYQMFRSLVRTADVVVENFRPQVKKKLGIDYETLSRDNERLVYGSISGYGQDGPYADRGAVDQIIQGYSGLMSVTGPPDGEPYRVGIAVADLAAGHQLAIGLLAALLERVQSGRGQWVRVSLLESMLSFLDFQAAKWTVDGVVAERAGNHHPSATPMGTFRASDGYINIAASSDRLWTAFCRAARAPELAKDERCRSSRLRHENREYVNARVQSLIEKETVATWIERLDAVGVPAGSVYTIDQAFNDPQVQHLGMAVVVEHPTRGKVRVLRQPVTMSRSQPVKPAPSPTPDDVDEELIAELRASRPD